MQFFKHADAPDQLLGDLPSLFEAHPLQFYEVFISFAAAPPLPSKLYQVASVGRGDYIELCRSGPSRHVVPLSALGRRNALSATRALVTALTGIALLIGCGGTPPVVPAVDGCESDRPLQIVVGVATYRISEEKRSAALKAVMLQALRSVRPGSPGLAVSVYPLTDQSFSSQPLRLRTGCIPERPAAPDLQQVNPFLRDEVSAKHRKEVARVQGLQLRNARAVQDLDRHLAAQKWPALPVDVWGFLALAAREFDAVDASSRSLILITPDEDQTSAFCERCSYPLRGAVVTFLHFDQPTPADQRRRQEDWTLWMRHFGAEEVLFARSNDPVPPLLRNAIR